MAEQNTLYIAMLTDVGAAQQAKAIASGTPWNITHMGVGDGNGVTPIPSKLQKKLVNENVRLKLNRLTVRGDRPVISAELILPSDIGGWWVREVGLYDSTGALVAVASYPPTYKPTLAQGTGRTQGIRLQILVSSTANITIQDDPTLVTATLSTVREEITKGNANSANKLYAGRFLTYKGAVTGQGFFDGSGDIDIPMTLADSGVMAGTYSKVTVNAKGLVTGAHALIQGDIPALDASKITTGTLSRPTSANAGTATKLLNGRALTFGGAATGMGWFDGSGDVNIQLALAALDTGKLSSGILPIVRGGTGGDTPAAARAALGAGVPSSLYHDPAGYWWDKDTGFFVQWGNRYVGDMPGGMQTIKLVFPYVFDTKPFIVIPVITQNPGGYASSATVTCAMNEKSLTPSECMLSFTEYISLVQDYGFRWIAVGYRVTPM
jgi:phage-related tail fiber protein